MSAAVVVKQMIMIALLIAMGFYSFRRKYINTNTTRGMSAMIVTFTNPCLMIYSMLSAQERMSGEKLLIGLMSAVLTYAFLVILAEIIPRLLRIDPDERYCYWMLCVFGNIGFIGIPLTEAVLGANALVYVCFHNLIFCLLVYTVGIGKIKVAANGGHRDKVTVFSFRRSLAGMINTGTVSALAALVFYVAGWDLPDVLMSTFDYAGRATTFLSMIILGAAVAQMSVKKAVTNVRLVVFSLIRLILIPIAVVLIFKLFINDALTVNTAALMLAVPAGNMPLIMATQHKLDPGTLSDGIVLTTVMSLVTIPIVTLFC